MQILAYDYFSDHAEPQTGLIQLADRIAALRAEPDVTTLLFDNGDFLQGNPLADYLSNGQAGGDEHPMIAAFNTLGYDAITLGNHEFDYGLPFLRAALAGARFPVVCANIHSLKGTALAQPYTILDRMIRCSDGTQRNLRIGVIGFVPPQVTLWERAGLRGQLHADDIVASAQAHVPALRAAGADIVVALCHSGIGPAIHTPGMENAAVPLAAVAGVDVILAGHTHEFFPGDSHPANAAIDPVRGTLHGKPAVMAGFCGNCLGVIDLELDLSGPDPRIVSHNTGLQQAISDAVTSPLKDRLMQEVQTAHNATLQEIRQPVAQTRTRLHSYFATLMPDLPQKLLAEAQCRAVAQVLSDTAHRDLPILSATAPFRSGGHAGAGHYIDVPPGPMALRDAAAIYPFTNTLCAVRRTGVQLRNWLERSAAHFRRIRAGEADQPLIDNHIPAYCYDTIFGLTYRFDLSAAARFGPDADLTDPQASRLKDLRHAGREVADEDLFVIATNSYRAFGGGGFDSIPPEDMLYVSNSKIRDILVGDLRARGTVDDTAPHCWEFAPIPGASALFHSAPNARHYMPQGVSHVRRDTNGFDLYRLTF